MTHPDTLVIDVIEDAFEADRSFSVCKQFTQVEHSPSVCPHLGQDTASAEDVHLLRNLAIAFEFCWIARLVSFSLLLSERRICCEKTLGSDIAGPSSRRVEVEREV